MAHASCRASSQKVKIILIEGFFSEIYPWTSCVINMMVKYCLHHFETIPYSVEVIPFVSKDSLFDLAPMIPLNGMMVIAGISVVLLNSLALYWSGTSADNFSSRSVSVAQVAAPADDSAWHELQAAVSPRQQVQQHTENVSGKRYKRTEIVLKWTEFRMIMTVLFCVGLYME